MSDIKELKDEELKKVTGGGGDKGVSCADFSWRSGYAPTEYTGERHEIATMECSQCSHYQKPEGPCNLGYN